MEALIQAYKVLITTRNAAIYEANQQGLNGLVARLKTAQREDWETVGMLRRKIKNNACKGEKA